MPEEKWEAHFTLGIYRNRFYLVFQNQHSSLNAYNKPWIIIITIMMKRCKVKELLGKKWKFGDLLAMIEKHETEKNTFPSKIGLCSRKIFKGVNWIHFRQLLHFLVLEWEKTAC